MLREPQILHIDPLPYVQLHDLPSVANLKGEKKKACVNGFQFSTGLYYNILLYYTITYYYYYYYY
jgi:hypothetical protein